MSMAAGARLGPYEIVAPLGAGGMGEVWKARDTRLNRFVALKILPSDKVADAGRQRRFVNEAQSASALNHLNIVTIYDIAEENGVYFIAMECVRGRTLEQLISGRALPLKDTIKYSAEIADALAAAHAAGIVHRDLKPANIMITEDGRAKVLDFGLAKLAEPSEISEETVSLRTAAGAVLGTPAYMSPEQAEGKKVDARSDIFSFGLVLYEMLCGRRAFHGATWMATLAAILREEPRPLREVQAGIPSGVEQSVARCLHKDPSRRFQSMAEVKLALEDACSPIHKKDEMPSIAVLPFANLSADKENEYFSDGITESIINSLTRIAQLRVTSRSVVFRYKGKEMDPQAIGRDLNVRVVLTGRVIQRGETLVVSAELADVAEGSQLWGERYNRKLSDIFALEEEIATKISESLRMKLTGEEKRRLAKRFTENSEAYQLYLRGRHYWTRRTPGALRKGIEYFQQAIDTDPAYALAYAGLADCYSILSLFQILRPKEGFARAKAAAASAVALDPELAEGRTSLAFIRAYADWDWAEAENEFRRAIELNPSYWVAPYWYGVVLTNIGRNDEGREQIRKARELEPLSPIITNVAAWNLIAADRYGEAIECCLKGLEIDANYALLRHWLGLAYEAESRYEEAIGELGAALRLFEGASVIAGSLAHAHALAGNHAEARRLLDGLLDPSDQRYVDPYSIAIVHAGLGERDRTLELVEKACNDRSAWLGTMAKTDPRLDDFRSDPRFRKILQRMGLNE